MRDAIAEALAELDGCGCCNPTTPEKYYEEGGGGRRFYLADAVMALLAEQPGVNIERSMRISNILDSTGQSTWQVGWSGTPGDDRMVEPGRYALVRLEDE